MCRLLASKFGHASLRPFSVIKLQSDQGAPLLSRRNGQKQELEADDVAQPVHEPLPLAVEKQ